MARDRHIELARSGSVSWNEWRRDNPDSLPDLSNARLAEAALARADLSFANLFAADLSGAVLDGADFNSANMMYADLSGAWLAGADFRQANLFAADMTRARLTDTRFSGAHASGIKLSGADLGGANLFVADISRADLSKADLQRTNFFGSMLVGSNLSGADCSAADLSGADLTGTLLAGTDLRGATLSDCRIKGMTAAGLLLEGTVANDLVLTGEGEAEIAVDGIPAGLFLSSLINGAVPPDEGRPPADAVLLMGRYPHERKGFLNGLREETRKAGLVPMLFDLEGGSDADHSGLAQLLAQQSLFVVLDLGGMDRLPREANRLAGMEGIRIQPVHAGPLAPGMTEELNARSEGSALRDLFQTDDAAGMITAFDLKVIEPLKRTP